MFVKKPRLSACGSRRRVQNSAKSSHVVWVWPGPPISVCMGGTKTQIPHPGGPRGFQNQKSPTPGPPGDSAHQIPHPLGGGGFQNSIIYQANFVHVIPDNTLNLILTLEYQVNLSWPAFFASDVTNIEGILHEKCFCRDFHSVHRLTKLPKSPIKPRGFFEKNPPPRVFF